MDTIQAIKERRAINYFEPGKTLPDETLDELLELANLAPSSFDLQPWKVVAVREPGRKKKLRECAMN
ncbi:partial nitroreductase / dihydropteridine reductase, partial [Anaerolineae bacterium]